MSKSLFLVDPVSGGHHPTYLDQMVQAADGMGLPTVVLTPSDNLEKIRPAPSARLLAYRPYWTRQFGEKHRYHALALWADLLLNLWRCRLLHGLRAHLVLLCWVDTYRIPALRPALRRTAGWILNACLPPWAGVLFHPTHWRVPDQSQRGVLDEIFSWRTCKAVALLDHGLVSSGGLPFAEKAIAFPDLIDDRPGDMEWEPVQDIQKQARGRLVVSLLGVLAPRKGILEFIQLPERLAQSHFFVLAGPVAWTAFSKEESRQLKSFLQHVPDNVYLHTESISDGPHFNGLIQASDMLYAAYHRFPHASNLVVKAAHFNKPILVSRGHYMDELVSAYSQGLAVDASDATAIAAALLRMATQRNLGKQGQEIVRANGTEALQNVLRALMPPPQSSHP